MREPCMLRLGSLFLFAYRFTALLILVIAFAILNSYNGYRRSSKPRLRRKICTSEAR